MDDRKEFRAWCESLTESDWLIAQNFEESFFLGAWAAWRHLRAALADATERAEDAKARTARACGCEWEDGSQRLHGGDLDVMCDYHRGVEGRAAEVAAVAAALKHMHDFREADRHELAAAIARADALAARLAEVGDREHPA